MIGDAVLDKTIKEIHSCISEMEAEISDFKIFPRRESYDFVALLMISKAFALSRAVLFLVEGGFPDEALGLSRSLVECSLTMRFITSDLGRRDDRARGFLMYGRYEKAYWFGKISDPHLKSEAETFLKNEGISLGEADAKQANGRWAAELGREPLTYKAATCDHPLDGDTYTKKLRESHFAVHYHGPSAFVHCTEPSLANYLHETGTPFAVVKPSRQVDSTATKCLLPICVDLYCVVAYATFGFQIESDRLRTSGSKLVAILKKFDGS